MYVNAGEPTHLVCSPLNGIALEGLGALRRSEGVAQRRRRLCGILDADSVY